MYSWWWVELSPETRRVKPLRRINAVVASCWIYFTTRKRNFVYIKKEITGTIYLIYRSKICFPRQPYLIMSTESAVIEIYDSKLRNHEKWYMCMYQEENSCIIDIFMIIRIIHGMHWHFCWKIYHVCGWEIVKAGT